MEEESTMMKIATIFGGQAKGRGLYRSLALAALMGVIAAGCTEEDNPLGGLPGTGIGDYGAPQNVRVTSVSSTSIGVAWERASGDAGTDTVVITSTSGGVAAPMYAYVASPGNQAIVQNLSSGQTYSIVVRGAGKASAASTWAPANRFYSFRLYETSDNRSGHYSGLILDPQNVRTVSVAAGSANRAMADIVFASDQSVAGTFTSLVSPNVSSLSGITNGKATTFSDSVFVVSGGLNAQYFRQNQTLGTWMTGGLNAADIAGPLASHGTASQNAILFIKTASNNYARVEIVRQPSGLFYGNAKEGSLDRFFVDINVSIQPTPNLPYAGRAPRRAADEPKRAGQTIVTLD